MIKRIKINRYKSIKDLTIHLDHLNVIFGPNASGKSNFLDALQLLSRIVVTKDLQSVFEPPYRGKPIESFFFDSGGIPENLKQDRLSFSLEVDIELSAHTIDTVEEKILIFRGRAADSKLKKITLHKNLRYRIEISIMPATGDLGVSSECLMPLKTDGTVDNSRKAFLEPMDQKLVLRMEGQSRPTYHDRNLPYSIVSLPLYAPHYPHVTAFKEELSRWLFFYFEPRERMRAPNTVRPVAHIGQMGENLAAFLNGLKAERPDSFKALQRAMSYILPSISAIDLEVNRFGEIEVGVTENGVKVPARLLSEGTLRLIGLLSIIYSSNPPSLVGFEEPENGIAPQRLQVIAQFLSQLKKNKKMQFIVTSHSNSLADMVDSKDIYLSQKKGASTVIFPLRDEPLFASASISNALQEDTRISELIAQGYFDGDH
ncbi:DUF2813 domain-containing protein [bacterium]|nr:DUF2813 domain-containing protein [bacterium]